MKAASLQELLSLVSPREGEFFMDPGSAWANRRCWRRCSSPCRHLVGVELLTRTKPLNDRATTITSTCSGAIGLS